MQMKLWHGIGILAVLVLAAFYPSLHAGYNSVDDLNMVMGIEAWGPIDLQRLFFPQGTSYYYRPLSMLTYLLDRDAWGTIASFMHLENVLLHLACALLVFAIAKSLAGIYGKKGEGIALAAALLFSLHPLTTESVCWISGRTDLLAGFFLLLSLLLFLKGLKGGASLFTVASGAALLLACLAKEVAVFMLPGLLWMAAVYPGEDGPVLRRWRHRRAAFAAPVAATIVYFILRHLALGRDTGISTALQGTTGGGYDLWNLGRVALKVYGFYFKKVFVPWPLNFGIVEVSGWYVVSGLLLAMILLWCLWRRDLPGAFVLMSFCVLSPALLVPLGKMAWTPVAERYLYIPIALLAPAAALGLSHLHRKIPTAKPWVRHGAMCLLFVGIFAATLHRAWIWQDNVRLYADTAAKSPDFPPAKAELANALRSSGREAEAEAILLQMQGEERSSGYLVDDLNLAAILSERGETREARDLLLPHLDRSHKKYYDLLQALLRINADRIASADNTESRRLIREESLAWLKEQQRLRPSPFTLYRIGQMQVALGQEERALESFRAAFEKTPADAYYRHSIAIFIRKLEK